jgi:phosphate starvation-inducible PhoH-like protein
MKMFLTRMGETSKMIITGDITQIDLPKQKESGLIYAKKILSKIPEISFNWFDKVYVVRHPLVKKIIDAFEKNEDHSDKHLIKKVSKK